MSRVACRQMFTQDKADQPGGERYEKRKADMEAEQAAVFARQREQHK